jgi:multiple sugar transport system substrate-binding protein
MIHLNLSICGGPGQDNPVLHKLLEEFQRSSPVSAQVDVDPLPWDTYRQELTSKVIHNRMGDVSQAGAPVASDMMAMNALRPFTPQELEQMGGKAAFAPVVWESVQQISEKQVWSIPWMADPRIFLYWRDLLEQARADEQTAFQSPENLLEASRRLQASGVVKPWGITTRYKHSAIHTVASWVWVSGGSFISDDGTKTQFLEPAALAGLKAYFGMLPFMAPESLNADYQVNNQLFVNRQSAVMLGNGETASYILGNIPTEMRSRLGVALPFGVPLVGSSSLVVWASSRNAQAAVSLVQFLAGRAAQAAYPISLDHLPVRLDVLDEPPYSTDPILQGFSDALRKGRAFPITKLSGLLEENLGNALVHIWTSLFADPAADLEDLIMRNLAPVARRYDNWME